MPKSTSYLFHSFVNVTLVLKLAPLYPSEIVGVPLKLFIHILAYLCKSEVETTCPIKEIEFTFDVENYSPSILTSSYEVYKRRNKLIFEILDSVQSSNIYRVYPHTFFCDKEIKNRCVANDKEIIYYHDSNHLSGQGSKFLVADIIGIIKKINK